MGVALGCFVAAGLLYVLSGVALAPQVLALRWQQPGDTALMRLRAEQGREPARPLVWTPLRRVSPSLLDAFLHAEDDGFAVHAGFDVPRMREAVARSWNERRIAGGASTISQQTVKNLFLSPVRNPFRKLKEALLTLLLEAVLPKPRILELYVNAIELGHGVYGVGAASQHYFGKAADRLAPPESALLAASISRPLARNPGRITPGLRWKQRLLLQRMRRRSLVPRDWLS